ncbi:ABC transporter permease [Thioalkalicoccus limnaeus]|uniref:ABC transporter permease n=1 Tax=Thioalkalicoccus limnaeus TaxID=120681 RepID=A0ABV4BGY4_9GAMM
MGLTPRWRRLLALGARLGLTLFAISLLTFGLLYLAPGDPADVILGAQSETATPDKVAELRERLGLDRPWPEQYLDWLARAMRGDLGASFASGEPVATLIAERFGATLELAAATLVLILVLSSLTGLLAAARPAGLFDQGLRWLAILTQSVPGFLLGLMLIYVFALTLGWLPVFGRDGFASLILPTIALGLGAALVQGRILRAELLEVQGQDYVRFARAKGLSESLILWRHVLRNALTGILTIWGTTVGRLLGGAVLIETVFAWPGLGRLLVEAVIGRDLPVIQGAVLVLTLAYVGANLLVDLLQGLLDPRLAAAPSGTHDDR